MIHWFILILIIHNINLYYKKKKKKKKKKKISIKLLFTLLILRNLKYENSIIIYISI